MSIASLYYLFDSVQFNAVFQILTAVELASMRAFPAKIWASTKLLTWTKSTIAPSWPKVKTKSPLSMYDWKCKKRHNTLLECFLLTKTFVKWCEFWLCLLKKGLSFTWRQWKPSKSTCLLQIVLFVLVCGSKKVSSSYILMDHYKNVARIFQRRGHTCQSKGIHQIGHFSPPVVRGGHGHPRTPSLAMPLGHITTLFHLMLQSWCQKTTQSLVNMLLVLWHNRFP